VGIGNTRRFKGLFGKLQIMKIAIGINGSGKYFEYTSQLYTEYNSLYDDVEFDFYLATWEDEIDYSNFEWITDYVRLNETDSIYYDITKTKYIGHQPHYMFTSYHLNKLIKKNNVKYDAIMQTRSDLVISREMLDTLVTKCRNGEVTERLLYNSSGVSTFYKRGSQIPHLWCNDYYFFGHPSSIEIFSMAWVSFFIDSTSKFYKNRDGLIMNHIWPAEYMISKGIPIQEIRNTSTMVLIREAFRFESSNSDCAAGWHPKHPSVFQIEKLLNERGGIGILNTSFKDLEDIFINTDKGKIESNIIKGISIASKNKQDIWNVKHQK
jgi:hypothetical protein